MRDGVTILNNAQVDGYRFDTTGLRKLVYAAIDNVPRANEIGALEFRFILFHRGKNNIRVHTDKFRGIVTLEIPKSRILRGTDTNASINNASCIGACLTWGLFRLLDIENSRSLYDFNFGKSYPIAVIGPKQIQKDARAEKYETVCNKVAALEGELAEENNRHKKAIERIQKKIRKAKLSKKYYERSANKKVEESNFLERLKEKTAVLGPEQPEE